jgi:hypothetical protein
MPALADAIAQEPKPDTLAYWLKPFTGYLDRQRKLAQEGSDYASQGSEAVRRGDMSGLAGMLLGPLNYVSSPINALLPTQEEAYAAFDGNTAPAIAGVLGAAGMALPGPKVKGVAKFADEAAEGITAYHGSPHTFDKFSMDKIGTGEGAQAYGHGLYFAENEKVAKGYREVLSPGHKVIVGGDEVNWRHAEQPWASAFQKLSDHGSFDEARRFARIERDNVASWGRDTARHDQTLKSLDELEAQGVKVGDKAGSMYQVRLNVKPDELLDWDRPLSEQPEGVRTALKAAGAVGPKHSDWSMTGGKIFESVKTDPTFAADMRASGVKGIRYKDAGSRSAEGGTSNFVIFDADLITILKRYGIPMTIGAGGLAMVNGEDMPPDIASQIGG